MAYILIVDDNGLNTILARDILQSQGYETGDINCGEDLMSKLQERLPDLILMDLRLPGISGFECLGLIREHESYARIPVIAFSATMLFNKNKMIETGFNGLIEKPFESDEFLETIRLHLPNAS